MSRLISVDIMRTIAILTMVQIHFFENLAPPMLQDSIYNTIHFLYELISAPSFCFLVGLSFSISLENSEKKGLKSQTIRNRHLKKGALLFLIGLIFAVVIWSYKGIFDWDILTLIGTSIIYLALTYKKPPIGFHGTTAFIILLISPYLQDFFQFQSAWDTSGSTYLSKFDSSFIVLGYFFRGYFPVFPWLMFPVVGFIIGQLFYKDGSFHRTTHLQLIGLVGLTLGCTVMLISKLLADQAPLHPYITNWTIAYSKYPATTSYALASLGLSITALASLEKISFKVSSHLREVAERFSKFSLSIYVIHHALHLWPLWIYSYCNTGNYTAYWSGLTDFYSALGLSILFLVACNQGVKFWSKKEGKYSLEWLVAKLSS